MELLDREVKRDNRELKVIRAKTVHRVYLDCQVNWYVFTKFFVRIVYNCLLILGSSRFSWSTWIPRTSR